jgi:sulfite reductase beta subunit-like hemoprotein
MWEEAVLGRIFGPKMEEVAEPWRRLHNEELHNMHASTDIIRVIKSKRMRWNGYIARMTDMKNEQNILFGKPEGK